MNRVNRKILLLLILFLLINTPVYGSIEIVEEYGKESTDEALIEEIEEETEEEIEEKSDEEVQWNIKTQSESEVDKLEGVLEETRVLTNKSNFMTQIYPYESEIEYYDKVNWDTILGMRLPYMEKDRRFSWPGLKSNRQVKYKVKHIFKNSLGKEIFREENNYLTYNTVSLRVNHLDTNEARYRVNKEVKSRGYEGYKLKDGYVKNMKEYNTAYPKKIAGTLNNPKDAAFIYEYELISKKENYDIESIDMDTGNIIDNDIVKESIKLSEDELSNISHKDLGFTKEPDYIGDEKLGYIKDKEDREYLLVTNINDEELIGEDNKIKLYFKKIDSHPLKRSFSIRYEDKDGRELVDRFIDTRFIGSTVNLDLYPKGLENSGDKYFTSDDFKNRLDINPDKENSGKNPIIQNIVQMEKEEEFYDYKIIYMEWESNKKIKKDYEDRSKQDSIEPNKFPRGIYYEGELYKPVENQKNIYKLEKDKKTEIVIWYEKIHKDLNSKEESSLNNMENEENIIEEDLDREEIDEEKNTEEIISNDKIEKNSGYLEGYSDNTVRPENNISRKESIVILDRILDKNSLELKKEGKEFKDLEESDWSFQAIDRLIRGGFIDGYKDGYFRPDEFITRGEAGKILFEIADLEESNKNIFFDIENHWAKTYINALVEEGIVSGYKDGSFRPAENITRAEFVTMVNKLLGNSIDLEKEEKQFKDLSEERWYYEDMQKALRKASD